MLAGTEQKFVSKKLSFSNKVEARYYGMYYNFSHLNQKLRYRQPATDIFTMYANTVGEYLYPLRKFNTPFSQWTVFTEYNGYAVWGLSATGELATHIVPRVDVNLKYDINLIHATQDKIFYQPQEDRTSSFVYPFIKLGINYFPLPECKAEFFITNKTMNLDIHYPSAYLLKRLFVGVSLSVTD